MFSRSPFAALADYLDQVCPVRTWQSRACWKTSKNVGNIYLLRL